MSRYRHSFGPFLAFSVGAAACSVHIPDGKLVCSTDADCPAHFFCRSSSGGRGALYCYSTLAAAPDPVQASDGSVEPPVTMDAMAASSDAAPRDAQLLTPDANLPLPPEVTHALPSASVSFATLGGTRSDGSYTLTGDGFEWATACDETGAVCMTGRIGP